MSEILVVNAKGAKQAKKLAVPAVKLPERTLAQVIVTQQQNADRLRPLARTRGLIRGGGAKPWKQKGTGRARAGSIRSPLFKGGGIIFGPTGEPRRSKQIPQAVRRAARVAILGSVAADGRLAVLSGTLSLQKTKDAAVLREKAGLGDGAILTVVTAAELDQVRGVRNLRNVDLTTTADLTAADVAGAGKLLMSEAAYQELVSVKVAPKKPAVKKAPAAKVAPKAPATSKASATKKAVKAPAKKASKQ